MASGPEVSDSAEVVSVDDGHVQVRGPLSFASVPALSARPAGWIRPGATIDVDLSAVSHADSAGLAMVLEWLSQAGASGANLRLRDAPEQMLAIARVSGLVMLFDEPSGPESP